MLVAIGPLAELAVAKLLNVALRERLDEAHAIMGRIEREAFAVGEKHGRAAALGWLLVGAASGFVAALAVGFLVFW